MKFRTVQFCAWKVNFFSKLWFFFPDMDLPTLFTEEQINKFTTELGLTKEQIIEFYAEFKAYDTDGSGAITSINLGIVNKVKHLSYN